jgi:hypothetical protein
MAITGAIITYYFKKDDNERSDTLGDNWYKNRRRN